MKKCDSSMGYATRNRKLLRIASCGRSRWRRRCRADRCSPEAGHVGNQSFHIGSIHSQRDHSGSFHLGGGRFQNRCQLSWRILTGRMSQRWPEPPTPALSMTSATALRIKNVLPPSGACSVCRTSYGRSGCRSRFLGRWRTVRVGQENRNPSKDRSSFRLWFRRGCCRNWPRWRSRATEPGVPL